MPIRPRRGPLRRSAGAYGVEHRDRWVYDKCNAVTHCANGVVTVFRIDEKRFIQQADSVHDLARDEERAPGKEGHGGVLKSVTRDVPASRGPRHQLTCSAPESFGLHMEEGKRT